MGKRRVKSEHTDWVMREARDERLVQAYAIRQRLLFLVVIVTGVLGAIVLGRWDKGAVDSWVGTTLVLTLMAVSVGLFIYLDRCPSCDRFINQRGTPAFCPYCQGPLRQKAIDRNRPRLD